MTTVGAIARVDEGQRAAVMACLAATAGVSTFEVSDRHKLGLVIEADSIEAAHDRVIAELRAVRGVLGVWPVYMNDESSTETKPTIASQECDHGI